MISQVLIIDDDKISRLITRKLIHSIDADLNIHECPGGLDGVNMLEKLRHTPKNIIVLLDINMPDLNGWEFLEQMLIKDLNFKNLKLFIVTSSIYESDRLKAEQNLLVEKLYHKPLSRNDLREILNVEK
ncbi:response regulator [Salinimicrobium sp. CAU 1759]